MSTTRDTRFLRWTGADRVMSVREELPEGSMPPLMSEMLDQEDAE